MNENQASTLAEANLHLCQQSPNAMASPAEVGQWLTQEFGIEQGYHTACSIMDELLSFDEIIVVFKSEWQHPQPVIAPAWSWTTSHLQRWDATIPTPVRDTYFAQDLLHHLLHVIASCKRRDKQAA